MKIYAIRDKTTGAFGCVHTYGGEDPSFELEFHVNDDSPIWNTASRARAEEVLSSDEDSPTWSARPAICLIPLIMRSRLEIVEIEVPV